MNEGIPEKGSQEIQEFVVSKKKSEGKKKSKGKNTGKNVRWKKGEKTNSTVNQLHNLGNDSNGGRTNNDQNLGKGVEQRYRGPPNPIGT